MPLPIGRGLIPLVWNSIPKLIFSFKHCICFRYTMIIDNRVPFNANLYLLPFAIVVGICFVLMVVFMVCCIWIHLWKISCFWNQLQDIVRRKKTSAEVIFTFATYPLQIAKWIRDIRKRRKSRLSKEHLKKIPIKKFKKGDPYDVCAICLDDYEEGEKLRVLPCAHGKYSFLWYLRQGVFFSAYWRISAFFTPIFDPPEIRPNLGRKQTNI